MIWDINLFWWLNNLAGKNGFFDWFIIFFAEYLGYLLGLVFIIYLLRLSISNRQKIKWFLLGLTASLVARLGVASLIRYFYHKPRPFVTLNVHQLIPESGYSFPSGHAIFFFALSAVVYSLNKKLGIWFMVASILMGVARVMAGVHYPIDIVSGAVLGLIVGFIVKKGYDYF